MPIMVIVHPNVVSYFGCHVSSLPISKQLFMNFVQFVYLNKLEAALKVSLYLPLMGWIFLGFLHHCCLSLFRILCTISISFLLLWNANCIFVGSRTEQAMHWLQYDSFLFGSLAREGSSTRLTERKKLLCDTVIDWLYHEFFACSNI